MTKRHADAIGISSGACNPSGMAHALVNACRECLDEGVRQGDDSAVRLIVSQIAYICGIWDGVADFARKPDFSGCLRECEKIIERDKEKERETLMVEAHKSGMSYWEKNHPIAATKSDLQSLARTLGWHDEANDAWVAGFYGAQSREGKNATRI